MQKNSVRAGSLHGRLGEIPIIKTITSRISTFWQKGERTITCQLLAGVLIQELVWSAKLLHTIVRELGGTFSAYEYAWSI